MRPVSAGFRAEIIKQNLSHLDRRFTWRGHDRSQYVDPYATITLDADQILVGAVSLPLINTYPQNKQKIWNTMLTTPRLMVQQGVIELGIRVTGSMLFLPFFTGSVDRVHFVKDTLTIQMRDKMVQMLRKTVGSTVNPEVYYGDPAAPHAPGFNPADLAWSILTNFGGLTNADRDYDIWDEWHDELGPASLNLQLEGNFTGQTIGWILGRIAELTSSIIFVRGDGRFVFYRYVPRPAVTYIFDDDNTRNPEVVQTRDEIRNDITCEWGYDGAIWDALSPVTDDDDVSIGIYGTYPKVEEDTAIWHSTAGSATDYCVRILERYANPRQYCIFETGLQGFILEPGDTFWNSIPFYGYSQTLFEIRRCEFNLQTGMVKIKALNASGWAEFIRCFRLDDEVDGLLDQDYNPLC